MNKRLQKLRVTLEEKGLDGIFVTQSANVRYLSGFDGGSDGYLIITPKKAILATDSRYWEQAEIEAPAFELLKTKGSYTEWFPKLLSKLRLKSLGFEGGNVTFEYHRTLKSALKMGQIPVKMVSTTGMVETIRMLKEPEEVELMKKAAEITDATFESVEKSIKAGMTELQIAWELEKAFHENGSEGLAFPTIVGSGPNAALPHAKPSNRPVQDGETIVIDMGGKYKGYANDITRTICLGKADAKLKEVYNVVLEAQQTASKNIRAGMTGKEADSIAREVIIKAGYGDAFGHSLGHGVGFQEHEQPFLSATSKQKLANGMVFTVEPGIYLPGWGGVRIEDTVIMENGKAVPLNKVRKMGY
jgi:Xaa-Pro aminopeptidase